MAENNPVETTINVNVKVVILIENGVLRTIWSNQEGIEIKVFALDTDDETYDTDVAGLHRHIHKDGLDTLTEVK
jgi:hypothetical protein